MTRPLIAIVILSAVLPAVAQQPQPNPAEVALKRMRDTLRTTMIQLQTAEAEKVTLQATLDTTKTESEKKIKDLTKELDALRKKSTEEKNTADKSILDLSSKLANTEQDLARTKDTLGKWKEGYNKAAAISVKKESERVALATKVVMLERRVASNEAKNAEMFKIGNEVLDRFKGFGLGTALVAREPFTGIMRVKLQNLMQTLEEKLVAQKIRPGDAEAAAKDDGKDKKDAKAEAPKEKVAETKETKTDAPKEKVVEPKVKAKS